jgi:hypothetical protein
MIEFVGGALGLTFLWHALTNPGAEGRFSLYFSLISGNFRRREVSRRLAPPPYISQ